MLAPWHVSKCFRLAYKTHEPLHDAAPIQNEGDDARESEKWRNKSKKDDRSTAFKGFVEKIFKSFVAGKSFCVFFIFFAIFLRFLCLLVSFAFQSFCTAPFCSALFLCISLNLKHHQQSAARNQRHSCDSF